jgi:stage III sporulation protein AH
MMVFKRKQIVVLSLVLMILVAGYLQYSYKKSSVSVTGTENDKLGEAVYVDNEFSSTSAESTKAGDKEDSDKKDGKETKPSKEVKPTAKPSKSSDVSKRAKDYFAEAKLEKETTRGRDTETLKAITENQSASKEAKAEAFKQMTKIAENSDREMRVETLIKKQGFEEVVALFGDDGSVDIVVGASDLTSAQTAQIMDIVSRQANVEIEKIHIRNIY